jgi:rSAM/selenodomain-associated transferase 1
MTALLIVFAKEPRPGHVKTRLTPQLSFEEAAQLYHSFLEDILEEMGQVPDAQLALAFSPPEALFFFQNLAPPDTVLFPQEGRDLGERMSLACARGFASGFSPVLLRGSDTPDLPSAVVSEAREVLAAGKAQVVLGPCPDGGYYLVGLTESQPFCFRVQSGPPAVLRLTKKAGKKELQFIFCLPGLTSTHMPIFSPF